LELLDKEESEHPDDEDDQEMAADEEAHQLSAEAARLAEARHPSS
jgi:hypothetical protein